eukprot:GHVP01056593.1.p1 GENE.GHVP01056593.1~~GHVP01056593.1.p1  ORF type:complete len:561 (-),score=98.51 GHVP01056593.1:568-2250(-)
MANILMKVEDIHERLFYLQRIKKEIGDVSDEPFIKSIHQQISDKIIEKEDKKKEIIRNIMCIDIEIDKIQEIIGYQDLEFINNERETLNQILINKQNIYIKLKNIYYDNKNKIDDINNYIKNVTNINNDLILSDLEINLLNKNDLSNNHINNLIILKNKIINRNNLINNQKFIIIDNIIQINNEIGDKINGIDLEYIDTGKTSMGNSMGTEDINSGIGNSMGTADNRVDGGISRTNIGDKTTTIDNTEDKENNHNINNADSKSINEDIQHHSRKTKKDTINKQDKPATTDNKDKQDTTDIITRESYSRKTISELTSILSKYKTIIENRNKCYNTLTKKQKEIEEFLNRMEIKVPTNQINNIDFHSLLKSMIKKQNEYNNIIRDNYKIIYNKLYKGIENVEDNLKIEFNERIAGFINDGSSNSAVSRNGGVNGSRDSISSNSDFNKDINSDLNGSINAELTNKLNGLMEMERICEDINNKNKMVVEINCSIKDRDGFILEIENFEESASDPARLFQTSFRLLEEEKFRRTYKNKLKRKEEKVMKLLKEYEIKYNNKDQNND